MHKYSNEVECDFAYNLDVIQYYGKIYSKKRKLYVYTIAMFKEFSLSYTSFKISGVLGMQRKITLSFH